MVHYDAISGTYFWECDCGAFEEGFAEADMAAESAAAHGDEAHDGQFFDHWAV